MAKNTKSSAKKPSQNKSSSKFMFWIIGLVAVILLGLIFLSNQKEKDDASSKEQVIDYKDQPFLGKEDAPVNIVEFGDYKCPICKDFTQNTVPLIQKEFVDTGKAKFYFMNYSFINVDSIRSAQFAEAVYHELGNDTFWKFHELLYSKQPEDTKLEHKDVFTESFLEDTLKEIASEDDVNKVMSYFKDKKWKEAWDKDMSYEKKLGLTGTPTIFINGKQFTGTTLDDLKKMVEDAAKGK